jgi:hypothetical protein
LHVIANRTRIRRANGDRSVASRRAGPHADGQCSSAIRPHRDDQRTAGLCGLKSIHLLGIVVWVGGMFFIVAPAAGRGRPRAAGTRCAMRVHSALPQ